MRYRREESGLAAVLQSINGCEHVDKGTRKNEMHKGDSRAMGSPKVPSHQKLPVSSLFHLVLPSLRGQYCFSIPSIDSTCKKEKYPTCRQKEEGSWEEMMGGGNGRTGSQTPSSGRGSPQPHPFLSYLMQGEKLTQWFNHKLSVMYQIKCPWFEKKERIPSICFIKTFSQLVVIYFICLASSDLICNMGDLQFQHGNI